MSAPYADFHLMPLSGTWQEGDSAKTADDTNPFNGQSLVTIRQASTAQLNAAYGHAAKNQPKWSALPPGARAEILLRAAQIFDTRKEEIISWLIAESGSTRIKATLEWNAAKAITLEAASFPTRVRGNIMPSNIPGKENFIYRTPLGVVGLISPWNFPLHLTQRSLAPALALGNAVVVKPATDTPITGGLLLAKIFAEAGLPEGILHVVIGSGQDIGDAFVTHPVPALISFTGSTAVGKKISALATSQEHLKKVALELGGNSPFVVLDDADLEQAVKAAVAGKFLHQGQICMAVNRLIVEAPVYDAFIERFTDHAKTLHTGDPDDPATAIGPIINANQLQSLRQKITTAQSEGARLVLEGHIQNQLMSPYIFADVTAEMSLARDETFGPIATILRAEDEKHALELANSGNFGLSSAVFSQNLARALDFSRKIHAGMTHINDIPVQDEAHTPFGGEKNSGLGRFNGKWAIEEFTTTHWISIQSTPRPYPF